MFDIKITDEDLQHIQDLEKTTIYEIYVYNDKKIESGMYAGSEAGTVSGWDIKFIRCQDGEKIENYPFFDCIISKNDISAFSVIEDFNS